VMIVQYFQAVSGLCNFERLRDWVV
jgi:hypothetical protein